MQTQILPEYADTESGKEANRILRSCVHCGFCTATCPTYQLLGDELDGPRGRIYQIKNLLEGEGNLLEVRSHLDRCLTCRSCESTCPSGVEYGRLLDIGREMIAQKHQRKGLTHKLLSRVLPNRLLNVPTLKAAGVFRPLLPQGMQAKLPDNSLRIQPYQARVQDEPRKLVMLTSCVQAGMRPQTNQAAKAVFARLGFELIEIGESCCGALPHHLDEHERALVQAKSNIDLWWPHIEAGAEGLLATASGCGVMLSEYGYLLRNDAIYSEKANKVSELVKDPIHWFCLANKEQRDAHFAVQKPQNTLAYHPPCTQQHGMKVKGQVEEELQRLGYKVRVPRDAHLCCGSAGTYSILQKDLSQKLLERKSAALDETGADLVLTANIGCQSHLAGKQQRPVLHWLEFLALQAQECRY